MERAATFFELSEASRGLVMTWRVCGVVATPMQADYTGLRSLVLIDKTTVRKRADKVNEGQCAHASSLGPE